MDVDAAHRDKFAAHAHLTSVPGLLEGAVIRLLSFLARYRAPLLADALDLVRARVASRRAETRPPRHRRPVQPCVALLLSLAVVLCLNSTASGLSAPPFPVIFVHGIAETALSWSGAFDFKESLVQQGWRFGGSPRFDPATLQVINVQPGDLYTMNFSDFGLQPYHSQYLSLDRQGYELSAIIQA